MTVQAPWLIPYEREFYWMIPAASLVLLVPFLIASAITERHVLTKRWDKLAGRWKVLGAVWLANGVSYGLLACYWGLTLRHAWRDGSIRIGLTDY